MVGRNLTKTVKNWVKMVKMCKKISQNCSAPVIGIGSGRGIDGQVAVIYDLLGISFNKIDAFFINDKKLLDKQITKFRKKLK